ncbi:MAG TPA: adenosylmethionine--8-amino-7-oxononanoate transaminase [Polyangiaceae bacterium]
MSERGVVLSSDRSHVWHPYTPMQEYLERGQPLLIARTQGSRLFDADGRSYIDANASWWSSTLGHQHPRLLQALKAQADQMCHVAFAGITHEPAAELARELCELAPRGLSKVFFSDDGSTAVEVALKLALQYWAQTGRPARTRFLALDGAFHGETMGSASVSGIDVFKRPFGGVLLDCLRVPPGPSGYQQAFEALERLLREHQDELAAVIVEPIVQGAAGMRFYGAEFLRALRHVTRELDVFLICDEVFSGYGRTGPFWASEHAAIEPDLLCTAKGFTAGMLPMAATLSTQRIFEGFLGAPERAFYYGHTFCGHPLGAAIAREVLRVYRDEQILLGAEQRGRRIAQAFEGFRSLPDVVETRSLGMIGALDLAGSRDYLEPRGKRVYQEALRRGAYLRPLGNTIYIAPSLNIPEADLDELLGIVEDSVRAA